MQHRLDSGLASAQVDASGRCCSFPAIGWGQGRNPLALSALRSELHHHYGVILHYAAIEAEMRANGATLRDIERKASRWLRVARRRVQQIQGGLS